MRRAFADDRTITRRWPTPWPRQTTVNEVLLHSIREGVPA